MKYIIFTSLFLIISSCGSQTKDGVSSSKGSMTNDPTINAPLDGSMGTTSSVRPR